MYHSTKQPTCPYKNKSADKAPISKAANSTRSAGSRTFSKPPSVKSGTESQHDQSAQTPYKYVPDDSVYDSRDRDSSGRVLGKDGKRYWVCCKWWDKKAKKWFYRLKDAKSPYGKNVRWVEEHYLHEWPGK